METKAPPIWDLSSEYPSLESSELQRDQAQVEQASLKIKERAEAFSPILDRIESLSFEEAKPFIIKAWEIFEIKDQASTLLQNLLTYVSAVLSTDDKNELAKQASGKLDQVEAVFSSSLKPYDLFLNRCSEEVIQEFLNQTKVKEHEFSLRSQRKNRDFLLSLEEEKLLTALEVDGFKSWSNLYNTLTSSISCELEDKNGEKKSYGMSQAAEFLRGNDRELRHKAYQGMHQAFTAHEETFAAMLNSIAGWRLELCKKRSHIRENHFLDDPLHQNRISKETLDTLLSVARQHQSLGRRAIQLQGKALGKKQIDPWDLLAEAPQKESAQNEKALYPFEKGMEIIKEAFTSVHPEMGEFAQMMQDKNWIEALPSPTKRMGAYCTHFEKSRTPRVFMTYTGTAGNVITLAHELGHAFHQWKLRELPSVQSEYPMTLAETASTFAEAVVRDFLLEKAESNEEKFRILWIETLSLGAMVINIPTRFEFEKAFYEERSKKNLNPNDFKRLLTKTWNDWYGESCPEANDMFWATKMHFYFSWMGFYNFPYLFGYLFSQGIYAQREKLGDQFYPFYVNLLQDTGRMSAEDLVKKHLNVDLTQPEFWINSLKIVEKQIDFFEKTLNERES